MTYRLRRCAVSALMLAALPLAELALPATSRADDGCGEGMYWNFDTYQCEPWVAVDIYIDPWVPVPIPNFDVVPIPNPPGVGLPGGPGGPGGPGRPGPGPRPVPRGGGGRR